MSSSSQVRSGPIGWLARIGARQIRWFGSMLALAILLAAMAAAWILWRDTRAEAQRDGVRAVALLVRHAAGAIEPVDLVLQQVQKAVARHPLDMARLRDTDLRALLPQGVDLGGMALDLYVADPEGRIVASLDPDRPLADAEMAAWMRDVMARGDLQLAFGQPGSDEAGHVRRLPLARVLPGPAGSPPAGVVVASLDPARLRGIDASELDPGWHVALLRQDDVVLATSDRGIDWAKLPRPKANASAVTQKWIDTDEGMRLASLQSVAPWPVTVAIVMDDRVLMAPWRERQAALAMLAVPAAAATLVLTWLAAGMAGRARGLSQKLDVTQASYRSLIEHSPEGILLVRDGTVWFANPAMARITGCGSPQDLVGRAASQVLQPLSAPLAQHLDAGAQEPEGTDAPRRNEQRLQSPEGAVREVDIQVVPDPQAGDGAAQVFVRDLSARRQAERALQRSEQHYRVMVEGARDSAFVLLDLEGRIEHVSQSAAGVLGPTDSLLHRPWSVMFPAGAVAAGEPQQLLAHAAGDARSADREGWCRRADDGRLWTHMTVSALTDGQDGVAGFHVQVRDVSAHRHLTEALAASQREVAAMGLAAEQEREREKRIIARQLHDDLGQVLSVQQLEVEMLRSDIPPGTAGLQRRVDTIQALASDALAVARRIAGHLRPLVLDDLGLVAALEWLVEQTEARGDLHATLSLDGECPALPDDMATALFRIAQQALDNTVRHADARHVQVQLACEPDRIRLSVIDDGRGVGGRAVRRGLGLRSIEERTTLLGGRFAIADAPGGGTRIDVLMPRVTAPAVLDPEPELASDRASNPASDPRNPTCPSSAS